MNSPEQEARLVCTYCYKEASLVAAFKDLSDVDECDFCRQQNFCIGLVDLAEAVHSVLQEHFRPLELTRWGLKRDPVPTGKLLTDWIEEEAKCRKEVADSIVEWLAAYYNPLADAGELYRYECEELYELKPAYDWHHAGAWDDFVMNVKTRARFFAPQTEEVLNDIFKDIHHLQTNRREPVIRSVEPGDDFPIFRGRCAVSNEQLRSYLENPGRQLGPPPGGHAASGRMNAYGIPVFYGATDPEVCISEIRPPVGSQVVTACFRALRRISLLDLPALEDALEERISVFHPEFGDRRSRVRFLQGLGERMSQPVMPGEEFLDYVPTQIVAAYLEHKISPHIDGIIFRSSQYDGDGYNVVLFNKSAVVADLDFKEYRLSLGANPVTVSAVELSERERRKEWDPFSGRRPPPWIDRREITLSLDLQSIKIHKVSGVRFDAWGSDIKFEIRSKTDERD